MAPPTAPPSQAGRFRPRKPKSSTTTRRATAVAIRPGATMGAPEAAAASTSTNPTYRRAGRGRGGRGRGRGGRVPIPQGRAFLGVAPAPRASSSAPAAGETTTTASTANTKPLTKSAAKVPPTTQGNDPLAPSAPTSAAAAPLSTKATTTAKRRGCADAMEEEVVVGEMEGVGVGGSLPPEPTVVTSRAKKKSPADSSKKSSSTAAVQSSQTNESSYPSIWEYDSDSDTSQMEDNADDDINRDPHAMEVDSTTAASGEHPQPPLTLPFPNPLPVGPQTASADTTTTSGSGLAQLFSQTSIPDHTDEWFLVQLPTRLPHQTTTPPERLEPVTSASLSTAAPTGATEKGVSTPALRSDAFDNSLVRPHLSSGPVGKWVVYENGQTELVWYSHGHHQPSTVMSAAEGLSCSFAQQAVLLDTPAANYIPLGPVRHTIVVTPAIDRAFGTSSTA